MCKLLWFSFYYLTHLVCAFGNESDVQVQLEDGVIAGKYLYTRGGRKFIGFMGIPFAKPPVGDLRFKVAVPNDAWNGILDATKVHSVCPQRDVYRRSEIIEGDEDCLYLNVYTPQLPQQNSSSLPVMVFFHGGGWLCGSGNSLWYGPDILLDRDIVLVVTNYRLGALGFLTTGDEVVSGNNGLKDQNLSLKWVQKNIHKFGGDTESVTIFGESAGGASSQYHMVSPKSKGLFKRIIAQSGTAFCTWALWTNNEGVKNSRKLATIFGCPTESSTEMVNCLRKVDANRIIEQDKEFMEWDYDPMIPFRPVIEPNVQDAFLTEHPAETIKSGKGAQVPLVIGINTEDGALKAAGMAKNPQLVQQFNDDFDTLAPLSLMYDKIVENTNFVTKKLKGFYFNDASINESSISSLTDLYTDGWFLHCADTAVRLHLKYSQEPVYYYLFGHRGVASLSQIFGGGENDFGVCHADELQYLFPVGDGLFPDKKPSDNDKSIAELLTTLWVNFAKTGNPTPDLSNVIKEKWEPVKSENMEYYYIDTNSSGMKSGLYLKRAELWRSFVPDKKLPTFKEEL